MSVDDSFQNLLTHVGNLLKEKGFRRTGKVFHWLNLENWAVISFQRSTKGSAQLIAFTVNLGVASGSLLRFFGNPARVPTIDQCHWRQRLGFVMPEASDRWWRLSTDHDSERLVDELSEALVKFAIPAIEVHLQDTALRTVWESGVAPGITETDRQKYLSALLKIEGLDCHSKQVAESLRIGAAGRPTADLAALHLARLGFGKRGG